MHSTQHCRWLSHHRGGVNAAMDQTRPAKRRGDDRHKRHVPGMSVGCACVETAQRKQRISTRMSRRHRLPHAFSSPTWQRRCKPAKTTKNVCAQVRKRLTRNTQRAPNKRNHRPTVVVDRRALAAPGHCRSAAQAATWQKQRTRSEREKITAKQAHTS